MSDSPKKLLRSWFSSLRDPSPIISFHVRCSCGRQLQGTRCHRHQVIPCPACQRPVFILARSPYPEGPQPKNQAGVAAPVPPATLLSFFRDWKLPILAGGGTLLVLLLLFWLVLSLVGPNVNPARIRAHLESGAQALEEGSFHRGYEELQVAGRMRGS